MLHDANKLKKIQIDEGKTYLNMAAAACAAATHAASSLKTISLRLSAIMVAISIFLPPPSSKGTK